MLRLSMTPRVLREVERANGNLVLGLTKRLVSMPKGHWPEELMKALWAVGTPHFANESYNLFAIQTLLRR